MEEAGKPVVGTMLVIFTPLQHCRVALLQSRRQKAWEQ